MANDVHYSFYIDGTVYDPFPDDEVGITDTTNLFAFGATFPPLGYADQQITADLDYVLLSYYGYNQDDAFRDDFSSSGFAGWTLDPPTNPGNFQESSGMARLNYLASSYPTTNTGGYISRIMSVPYKDAYFTYAVKVFEASDICSVTMGAIDESTALISLTPTSVTFYELSAFPGSSTVSGLTLDDGDWHIIGMRRHAIPFVDAPTPGASLSHMSFRAFQ
jgi:hypothetical protein